MQWKTLSVSNNLCTVPKTKSNDDILKDTTVILRVSFQDLLKNISRYKKNNERNTDDKLKFEFDNNRKLEGFFKIRSPSKSSFSLLIFDSENIT